MRWWQWAACWVAGGYAYDVLWRTRSAERAARRAADASGKPMINVGSGTAGSSLAYALLGPSRLADVNLDLEGRGICPTLAELDSPGGTAQPCQGDAHRLPYPDRAFGAALCTHVLEHVADPDAVLAELRRVADRVYVVTPTWPWAHTWLHPGHRWLFAGGRRYRLRGRRPVPRVRE